MPVNIADSPTDAEDGDRPPMPIPPSAEAVRDPLVEEDLLVEDVSIDGMCGVY